MSDKRAQIYKKMREKYGGDRLFRANETDRPPQEVIPFPSPSIGDASHYWGVPLNRLTLLFGPEGGGKTFLAMLEVKEMQAQYPNADAIWVDAESSFDEEWAESIGIDLDRLIIVNENDGADVFRILCGRFSKGKKIDLGYLDHMINGDLDIKLIVIDSIAHIIPTVEDGRDFDEQEIGALARFLPKALRRLTTMVKRANCACILINQGRDDIGARHPTLTYPGGRALRHAVSLAIKIDSMMGKDNELFDEHGRGIGRKTRATIAKTRRGPSKYQAEFWLDYTKGVVKKGEEVALLGDHYGVVERPSTVTWVYGDTSIAGKDKFFDHLNDNPEQLAAIIASIQEIRKTGARRPEILNPESAGAEDALIEIAAEVNRFEEADKHEGFEDNEKQEE